MSGARVISVAVIVVGVGVLAACSGSGSGPVSSPSKGSSVHAAPAANTQSVAPAAELHITPANDSKDANPASGISVSATNGKVTKVTVTSPGGGAVAGADSADQTSWHSTWALGVAQSYTVTATALSADGHAVTSTSTFSTLTPAQTFQTQIFEGYDQTYGVGIPVMLTFSQPITDKAAVERSLELTTSKPVIGAWYWDDAEHLMFRPRDYWPAGATVSFTGHLDGVEGAPGVYGAHTLTQTFYIGRSVIAVASTSTHRAKIYLDGKLTYNWPMSSGRPSLPTPDGTYLTVEKGNPVRMTGHTEDFYDELVYDAVRFTYSGDYFHSAPWSVSEQGVTNVSHGCVNLSPSDAAIYYNLAVPGDPISIVNSPAAGKWDDGFTPWFLTWSQYLRGSALHQAVQAGPSGSTFVDPATLPADTATAPIGTSASGNARAYANG